jgi:hypothetical protein
MPYYCDLSSQNTVRGFCQQYTATHTEQRATATTTAMKFLILALALGVHADYLRQEQNDDNVDPCGNPTDVCMNQDNWNKCRSLIESGCQMLEIMESCPLQFACGDDDEERKLTDNAEDDVSVDKKSKACVSLFVYEDKKCRGEPVRSITLPTWNKPGSPCCKL